MKGNIKRDLENFAVLATDIAVLTVNDNELKVLLTRAKSINFKGISCLPGGLVDVKETTEAAAKRILDSVIKTQNFYLEQLYTFDNPKRDPAGRVVSVAYLMLVPWVRAQHIIKETAHWQSVKNLPELAYDHKDVVASAIMRLANKITYTNIVHSLLPMEFSLSALQKVYEVILEQKLDKRNFVKKIKSLKLLKKTGRKVEGQAHRPAALYRFASRDYMVVEVF